MRRAVVALSLLAAVPRLAAQSTTARDAEVRVEARVVPETVFVGQAARYELSVFIRSDVRRRLRRNPEYVPPELRGLVGYDLRDRDSVAQVTRDGVEFEVHRFTRHLFPVAAGRHEVAAARLTYAVPLGPSFFSREESRALRSNSVAVTAVAPPERGRPATWDGAVGDLTIAVAPVPSALRRGDPFVLTLRVTGLAHIPMLPRPALSLPWASTVASDERVTFTVADRALRGTKEFDWLVTPTEDGSVTIPPIAYSYFDPVAERYRNTQTAALTLTVRATDAPLVSDSMATVAPAAVASRPTLRAWSGSTGSVWWRAWWFWLLAGVCPLPALWQGLQSARGMRRGRIPDVPGGGRLDDRSSVHVRRAYVHTVLASRFAMHLVPWGDVERAVNALRREGVTAATARALIAMIATLDACCYGGATDVPPSPAAIRTVLRTVLREARPAASSRTRWWRRAAVLALVSLPSAGRLVAQAPAAFEAGLALAAMDASAAADSFVAAARAHPRATAAWANAAMTSWQAGDTARTVVAWQRVARLAPLDADARVALRRLGAWRAAPAADVWSVPVPAAMLCALLLWGGGWIALLRAASRRIGAGCVAAALGLAGLAVYQQQRLEDPRVAVIARPTPMRPLPALAADGGLLALTGEVVVVRSATPVWLRIDAADGRSGWVDARDVLTLDARPWRR